MHFIKSVDRNQSIIFSSLDSMVACDHPVRILDAIIHKIVQSNPEEFGYKGKQNIGRRAYSPSTMLKLFVYGYLNGISSSRKLEIETYRNLELKWLLCDLKPDHKTIANYRKENAKQIRLVTVEFRKFLKTYCYIKGKKVALDGTKIKANTNRDMLSVKKIEKRLSNLDELLEKYLDKLAFSDARDDTLDETECYEEDLANKELIQKITFLKLKIEKLEQAKNDVIKSEKKNLSLSDPDARLMKSRNGYIPAYNVQVVVDDENHMIAEAQASTSEIDKNELIPVVKLLKKEIGIEPTELLADTGYHNQAAIKTVEDTGKTKCFIPGQREVDEIKFTYDRNKDVYVCPRGKQLKFKQNRPKDGQNFRQYRGKDCKGCPIKSKCTKSKTGRYLYRHQDQDWRNDYKAQIKSEYGKKIIGERKKIVEHAFGTIKYWMGQIPLLMRGKLKVQTEINIYTTAYNFKRLMNIESFGNLMEKISQYEWKIEERENYNRTTPVLNAICIFVKMLLCSFCTRHFFRESI